MESDYCADEAPSRRVAAMRAKSGMRSTWSNVRCRAHMQHSLQLESFRRSIYRRLAHRETFGFFERHRATVAPARDARYQTDDEPNNSSHLTR